MTVESERALERVKLAVYAETRRMEPGDNIVFLQSLKRWLERIMD